MYAATNLNDAWLAFGSAIYGVCCVVVLILKTFKRMARRRTKATVVGLIPRRGNDDPASASSMIAYRLQGALTREGCRA
jgi:hypothetical protein